MRRTTERTPSRRWLVPRNPCAASASAATASSRTFDGPEPKRPSPGRRSFGSSIAAVVVTRPSYRARFFRRDSIAPATGVVEHLGVHFLSDSVNRSRELRIDLQVRLCLVEVVIGFRLLERALAVLTDQDEGGEKDCFQRNDEGQELE